MNTPDALPTRRTKSGTRFNIRWLAPNHTVLLPRFLSALCALAFCSNQGQAAPAATDESGCQLTIELRDGSRVVGKSLEDTLSFHSAALGDMKLSWAGIRSIEYADTNTGTARLTAANGDAFAIQFTAESLRVETGFGQTELPVKLIRSVKVSPPGKLIAAAGTDTARLTIELRDGSHVIGKSLEGTLNFHTAALGDLKLAWTGIRSIEYAGASTDLARLTAANGDVYEVQFAIASLGVETSFGKTELPVKLIRSIRVSVAGNAGQWPSGLVARWTGDGNAKDSAGHYDGQESGGLRYVPGPAGQAFQFNGGAAQVNFGSSVGNFGTSDFTIAYWMKTSSTNPKEAFMAKRTTCDAAFCFWEIQLGGMGNPPTGVLNFVLAKGGNQVPLYLNSSRPMNDGQWHHIAWVRQAAGSGSGACQLLLYVDGALDNSKTLPAVLDLASQTPLILGQNVCQCCDGCRPYRGAAADLQIFSQALSVEEIITIYQAGNPRR
jgi:hypothetical protein